MGFLRYFGFCALLATACGTSLAITITAAPAGPYHVEGNRILDARGRAYLIRGTSLPELTEGPPDHGFGPYSVSALITLRTRMNLNAVRLPLAVREYLTRPSYRELARRVVERANRFNLLVILEARSSDAAFWKQCAADFRSYSSLFFAAPAAAVPFLRAAGAQQPIAVVADEPLSGANLIYEVPAGYAEKRQFRAPADRVPVLASGLDPELDQNSAECAAFPHDPADAAAALQENLRYFDQHAISWTISTLRPGRLVSDYRYLTWTKLDDGWTCGASPAQDGIALVVLSHLWHIDPHGLFAVNQTTGGFVTARGSIATAYGPIMADRELSGAGPPWPTRLGNISVRITDSRGVARLAPLLHTGAGWAFTSFVVPEETAPGAAEVAIVRSDGTLSAAPVLIRDVAPGFWTAAHDGRGPVIGHASRKTADGKVREFPTWECDDHGCRTAAIPLSSDAVTTLRLEGTGFRHTASPAAIRVTIDDVPAPVVSYGPIAGIGRDQITVRMPDTLRGRGEVDIMMWVADTYSNVARIDCGSDFAAAYRIAPPQGFPAPPVPADNPLTGAKVELGRRLFYDRRMSLNGTTSCATCHHQELAFTDGRAQAVGATGQQHPRSAMSLVDLAYNRAFNWSDPTVHSLEEQALKPMFSASPVELGLNVIESEFLRLTRADPIYSPLFRQAFPGESDPYSIPNVAKAIAAFERTIVTQGSPYDQFRYDRNGSAISESAKRGEILYFLDGGPQCFRCHGGFTFSDTVELHNNGLYNPYPQDNPGLFAHTHRPEDAGKFRAPTLRNIALTAPYMHDGSIATLGEVVDHYAAAGRGSGREHPAKDKLVHGFYLTPQNRADLVAFLESLTDLSLTHDPRFADLW